MNRWDNEMDLYPYDYGYMDEPEQEGEGHDPRWYETKYRELVLKMQHCLTGSKAWSERNQTEEDLEKQVRC